MISLQLLGHHQFSPAISVGSNTNLVWPFLYDEIVHPGNGITVENKVAIEKIVIHNVTHDSTCRAQNVILHNP